MIKVMWFLKRAEHLSLAEFRRWWLEQHAADIAADQRPFLRRYKVDVRVADDAPFAAGRPGTDSPWDGIAEQWFDSVEDYNAVYQRGDRPTRGDTLAHTSRFERLVVEEHEMPVLP
ncbi:MAG: EthD domain-containing protein [Proteobacteria bacterium]|nr:EthD domain-containing protein [Pseudomonadota bacterium]